MTLPDERYLPTSMTPGVEPRVSDLPAPDHLDFAGGEESLELLTGPLPRAAAHSSGFQQGHFRAGTTQDRM